MSRDLTKDFTEFEVHKLLIKFADEESYSAFGCTGSVEREISVKKIQKKCEGAVTKNIVRPTGEGSLKINIFVNYGVGKKMRGAVSKNGVTALGDEKLPSFKLKMEVKNEDGEIMFQEYGNCILASMPKVKIDNSSSTVEDVELDIDLAFDENKKIYYEAFKEDLQDKTIETFDGATLFKG